MESPNFTLEDYIAWEEISYLWARALDGKDWDLLRSILAPKITMDFRDVFEYVDEDVTAEAYVTKTRGPDALGPSNRKTMHLFGASRVQSLSLTTATAWRQLKAHNFLFDKETKEQIAFGNGHGELQFFYTKIDSEWKLQGVKGTMDFVEGNIQAVLPKYPTWKPKF